MEREPLGQALNAVISVLAETGEMVRDDHEYYEVAAEKRALNRIVILAQLILSVIRDREENQLGVLRKIRHHS
jgi:hypothetical protein